MEDSLTEMAWELSEWPALQDPATERLVLRDGSVAAIRRTVASDRDSLGRCAHKLKGASANLHMDTLAAIAFDIETRAKAGEDSDWNRNLERVSCEFVRVAEGLKNR